MPLETAAYLPDLVASNPAQSDPLGGSGSHLRLIKGVLKATFPNWTSAALSSTQAQLDAAVSTIANGVSTLADAGATFKTNTTDGITNPAAGEIDIKLAGVMAARFLNSSGVLSASLPGALSVSGSLTATGPITGPGVIPIGGMIMWLSDTLPTVGSWCWANGGTLSRTGNGAALYALWGTTYGAGDGVTTFNVINMQEVAPVGKSGMGGGTSPGLLASISSGLKGVLGGLFGSDTSTLATANLPPYTPSGSVVTFTDTSSAIIGNVTRWANGNSNPFDAFNPGAASSQQLRATGSLSGNAQGGTSTPFGNTQPSRALNFIIRIG